MALAAREAQRYNHPSVGTEHLLLGLVKEGTGVGAQALMNLGVDLDKVRYEFDKLIKPGTTPPPAGRLPQSRHLISVIVHAVEEARNLEHPQVGTEHLLLGLLREGDGMAATFLRDMGLNLADVRREVLKIVRGEGSGHPTRALPNLPIWITLEDLKFEATIGAEPEERATPQEVNVNVELEIDGTKASQSDELADTVDYAELGHRLVEAGRQTKFKLLEALARHLLETVMSDSRLLSAHIELSKSRPMAGAGRVVVAAAMER